MRLAIAAKFGSRSLFSSGEFFFHHLETDGRVNIYYNNVSGNILSDLCRACDFQPFLNHIRSVILYYVGFKVDSLIPDTVS